MKFFLYIFFIINCFTVSATFEPKIYLGGNYHHKIPETIASNGGIDRKKQHYLFFYIYLNLLRHDKVKLGMLCLFTNIRQLRLSFSYVLFEINKFSLEIGCVACQDIFIACYFWECSLFFIVDSGFSQSEHTQKIEFPLNLRIIFFWDLSFLLN